MWLNINSKPSMYCLCNQSERALLTFPLELPCSLMFQMPASVCLFYEELWLNVSVRELAVCSQGVSGKMCACEGEERGVEREKAHISYFLRKLWSSGFLSGAFDRSQDSLNG